MRLGCLRVGLFVLFTRHLVAALLAKKPPRDGERHATMVASMLLAPTLVTQPLPPTLLPLLSLFFAAHLRRAR